MPILRDLEHDVQSFLAGGCHLRTASKGCAVCEKGSFSDGFFFVVTGRIKLAVLSAEGAERVIDILLPGCSFGESAALLQQPCRTHAETFSRELHDLAREGIVDIERRTIRILSPDRLRHRCEAV